MTFGTLDEGFYWVTRTVDDLKEVALWWHLGWHFVGDDNAEDDVFKVHGDRLQPPD